MSEENKSTREFHRVALSNQGDEFSSWSMAKKHFLDDTLTTVGARVQFEQFLANRMFLEIVLAAEIFPDINPPEIYLSESEEWTHNELRKKNPSKEARISGEAIQMKGGVKFFMLDAVSVGDEFVSNIKMPLTEIADLLISKGYVPVDSEFNVIPTTKPTIKRG